MTSIFRHRVALVAAATSAAMLVVYQLTLAPSVSFIDSGELSSVSTILGIAHPTGYPLFTLMGRVVSMLPWGSEEIVRLNFFSSVLTALAVGLMVPLSLMLGRGSERSHESGQPVTPMELAVAASGSLVFGTSATVWAQSAAVEVYPLHVFLVVIVILSFLKGLLDHSRVRTVVSRWLVLGVFCLGLSFANHMTTVLLVPALAYLYFRTPSTARPSLARLSPWFILGLSPYVYVLVRSSARPPLDWGQPSTLEGLLWHVSGKQYRSWIFSGFESASKQFSYFVGRLPEEFSWIALVLALIGFASLWKTDRLRFGFLVILFASCVGYAINYDIHDIDSYFLLAFLVIGLGVTVGMRRLALALASRYGWRVRIAAPLACAALAVLQFGSHRAAVDQSDNYLVEDYSRAILRNLDSNAVVLSYQWDYFVSPALYYQHVRRERPDVVVIDKELLRRSWYFTQLERNWPWLVARSRGSIDRFLVELRKFERGLPYRYEDIESSFNFMINDLIRSSMADRPVYVGPEIEPQFGSGLERVPAGLLFRLEQTGTTHPVPGIETFDLRPTRYWNPLVGGLRLQCAKMLVFRALWLSKGGLNKEALEAVELAKTFEPTMRDLARLEAELRALQAATLPKK